MNHLCLIVFFLPIHLTFGQVSEIREGIFTNVENTESIAIVKYEVGRACLSIHREIYGRDTIKSEGTGNCIQNGRYPFYFNSEEGRKFYWLKFIDSLNTTFIRISEKNESGRLFRFDESKQKYFNVEYAFPMSYYNEDKSINISETYDGFKYDFYNGEKIIYGNMKISYHGDFTKWFDEKNHLIFVFEKNRLVLFSETTGQYENLTEQGEYFLME